MGVLVGVVEETYLEAAVVWREPDGHVSVSGLVADHHDAASLLVGFEEIAFLPLRGLILVSG